MVGNAINWWSVFITWKLQEVVLSRSHLTGWFSMIYEVTDPYQISSATD